MDVSYSGNLKWLKITTSVNERENASNRHDVICPTFIIKAKKLIDDFNKSLTKHDLIKS